MPNNGYSEWPLFKTPPGVFKLSTAADHSAILKHPFFYMDDCRVFFVRLRHWIKQGGGWAFSFQNATYTFETFYHAYVSAFLAELNRNGVDGLLRREVQLHPPSQTLDFSKYNPDEEMVAGYPFEDIDFGDIKIRSAYSKLCSSTAYALYNWELFFHAPLLIADRLSKNQRYEEAHRWFHYIFNPTDTSSVEGTKRYWQTRPFHEKEENDYLFEQIEKILELSTKVDKDSLTEQEKSYLARVERSIDQWRANPFKPHIIARLRTTAYQKTVVMKYLDNLIAWADQLFRRDTIESINEATQLYILAADILGERPGDIPPRSKPRVQTYNSLKPDLDDEFSNAWVAAEELVALSPTNQVAAPWSQASPKFAGMLYFCVPSNDKLLGYWDTVADRLFKIRHCMNIEGIVRQLPLFEPPIEPGLLVRAAAAGVDLTSVLNDLSAPLPHYRFNVLVQKASELCGELKSLGQAMLSALEKEEAEKLALLRAEHETALLKLVEEVKSQQKAEAEKNKEALLKSREMTGARWKHFQRLLGVQNPTLPERGQTVPKEPEPSPLITIQEQEGVKLIAHEKTEMDELKEAEQKEGTASTWEFHASIQHNVPNFTVAPWGIGPTFGGSNVGAVLSAVAAHYRSEANTASHRASESGKLAQLAFRANDWLLQNNQAAYEIEHIDRQLAAADVRCAIADKELTNHQRQIEHAQEVEDELKSKFTNQELYGWMIGQLATVYFQAYQLTYDLSKRAERAFRHELALNDSNYIQFGYWDSLKKGLLAGERLFHDIKRMELAYLDQHQREYEITKHVSLAQLDPLALIELRENGSCQVSLPEALFDLDMPGHYLRRIKTVSLSIPCVTGPYTGVNCTLTLLKSRVRHSNALPKGKYARSNPEPDPRFTDNIGMIESIVTSSGQNDSGLFEANLRDERYLPFEGAGVISEWKIELPDRFRPLDYDTISDVILHLRYTAREGGGQLRQKAVEELDSAINQFIRSEGQEGLARLFSLRHEFPTAWHDFLAGAAGHHEMKIDLTKERFPFLFSNRIDQIIEVEVFIKVKDEFLETHNENTLILELASGQTPPAPPDAVSLASWNGVLRGSREDGQLGTWTLYAQRSPASGEPLALPQLDAKALEDILLICLYSIKETTTGGH